MEGFNGTQWATRRCGTVGVTVGHGFVVPWHGVLSGNNPFVLRHVEYRLRKAMKYQLWCKHLYVSKNFFVGGFDLAIMTERAFDDSAFKQLALELRKASAVEWDGMVARFDRHGDPPFDRLLQKCEAKYRVADVGYAGLSGSTGGARW